MWDLNTFNQHLSTALDQYLYATPHPLKEAIQYSLQGGKRFRAQLIEASAQLCEISTQIACTLGIAAEFFHAYSLVHDDLPAMDDDALRRNRPSCHIAFNESTAILVGDALQSMAFEQLTSISHNNPASLLQVVQCFARAVGPNGMVAGQYLDLHAPPTDTADLIHQHQLKTGALFEACLLAPAYLMPSPDTRIQALKDCGHALGLAYQAQDDQFDGATLGASSIQENYARAHSMIKHYKHSAALSTCIEAIEQRTH